MRDLANPVAVMEIDVLGPSNGSLDQRINHHYLVRRPASGDVASTLVDTAFMMRFSTPVHVSFIAYAHSKLTTISWPAVHQTAIQVVFVVVNFSRP